MEASMGKAAESVPLQDPSPATPTPDDAAADPAEGLPVIWIERRPGWQLFDLAELWRYRELLFFLTWRDIKVRYKQTVLGAAWAILQPLTTMLVFCLFFHMASDGSAQVPYPLFVFIGLVPWFFFANAIAWASQSVVCNYTLVTKIYFPRLIIPMAAVTAGLVDFVIAFGLMAALMLFYGVVPGWGLLLAPVLFAGLVVAAVGVGTLLAALTVAYRDFRHVVPFMVQLWMFATPAIYLEAASVVGPQWRPWLALNPANGLIADFRAALLGTPFDCWSLAVSTAVCLGLLVAGCLYYRHVERRFADII